jgi:hypothetical protein
MMEHLEQMEHLDYLEQMEHLDYLVKKVTKVILVMMEHLDYLEQMAQMALVLHLLGNGTSADRDTMSVM